MAECFFCGRDEKLTRAHLFQQQFRDVMGKGDGTTRIGSASHAVNGVDRAIEYGGDVRRVHVTALCGDCNNVWMNGIESAAAPAFATIVRDHSLPPPEQLLKLAHWATVVAALSSKFHGRISVPVAMRREIRIAQGQPDYYATFFVWACDELRSVSSSFFRVAGSDPEDESKIGWYHFLHAGPMVAISCTPSLYGRVARVLCDANIYSVIGCLADSVVYMPRKFGDTMKALRFPSHYDVHQLGPIMLGAKLSYAVAKNQTDLLDLTKGLTLSSADFSFDFEGLLFDYRQLPVNATGFGPQ